MKINVKSPGKIALSLIMCGLFITSCSNSGSGDDTNPATTVGGTDTELPVSPDSLAADHTRLPPTVDTTKSGMMTMPDSAVAGTKIDTASKAEKSHKK